MVKQLIKVGNSQALLLDKNILRLLDATEETSFKLKIESGRLIIEPLQPELYDEEILKVAKSVSKKQSKVFEKLAK